jgi:cytochrome bd-type quinol oxidase subunit 2
VAGRGRIPPSPERGDVTEPKPRRSTDWLRLASSAPAVLGFLGIVVYGVVRTGHDAFYARFGVTAEEVGLSQTTIVGRASLYFVFFLTAVVSLVGISAVVARRLPAADEAARSRERRTGAFWARVGVSLITLTAATGLGGLIVAGIEGPRSVAMAVAVVLLLALVAALGRRLSRQHRVLAGVLFAGFAVWSGAVAYAVARTGTESEPGAASLPAASRWLLFAFCLLAVATASASLLRQFETASRRESRQDQSRRQTYMLLLSVLAALPLALVFLAPGVGRFLTEAGDRTAAAIAMWAFLFGFVILAFEVVLERPPDEPTPVADVLLIISLSTLLAFTALFLAWERGLDLANQVLAGNRITQSGFSTFSVRADIVCLEPEQRSSQPTSLPDQPVVYLGQSGGQLVLFDLERKETLRAREQREQIDIGAPDRVPIRIPSSGLIVRVANLLAPANPYVVPVTLTNPRQTLPGKWTCFR